MSKILLLEALSLLFPLASSFFSPFTHSVQVSLTLLDQSLGVTAAFAQVDELVDSDGCVKNIPHSWFGASIPP